ncbi:MAG: hypothetical protein OHK0045_00880 [Raineya sp.]
MLEHLQKLLHHYLELRVELLETDLKEQAKELLVKILLAFFYLFLASAGLLLSLFGLAYYLNVSLGSQYVGFFLVGSLFFIFFGIALMPAVRKVCNEKLNKYFTEK